MKRRRPSNLQSSFKVDAVRRLRGRGTLRIEPLEARRLLAGLQVNVFIDHSGTRSFEDSSDTIAPNRLVYIDIDANGAFDPGEPIAATDDTGTVVFEDLAPGEYEIGLLTNPDSQRQTTHTAVESTTQQLSSGTSATLLTDNDLYHVWSVSPEGTATQLPRNDGQGSQQVALGGQVLAAMPFSTNDAPHQQLLVVQPDGSSSTQLLQFDLATGNSAYLRAGGLGTGGTIVDLLSTGDQHFALLATTDQLQLLPMQIEAGSLTLGNSIADDVLAAAVSSSGEIAVAQSAGAHQSTIRLLDDSFGLPSEETLVRTVESLSFSESGELLLVAMANGGVEVFRSEDRRLQPVAILEEAAAPMSARSSDGRIVTASARDASQVIVWDPESWLPEGTTRLPMSRGSNISDLATDSFSDELLISSPAGVYSANLALATPAKVSLVDDFEETLVMGLRPVGTNTPPMDQAIVGRPVLEDSEDPLSESGFADIEDPDGDQLWFSLSTEPKHGELQRTDAGLWTYIPHPDYSGPDNARFKIYDGADTAELVVQWDVQPVNDPPVAIHIQLQPVPEDTQPGSAIGFVSVEDPDLNPMYDVSTSDPRFRVSNGQVFFDQGELDFENEGDISFEIMATDVENPAFQISATARVSLQDVDEAPTRIELSANTVAENEAGQSIGTLRVDDPDAGDEYEFSVNDPRFEVVGGVLKLVDGESLDFEAESYVPLTISARQSGTTENALTSVVQIQVSNRNDAPSQLIINGSDIESTVPGAPIGTVSVVDQDGDDYDFAVSDDRFEVAEGVLKLRDDQELDAETEVVHLTVSAVSRSGDSISTSQPIGVIAPPPPHQNPQNPSDINGDGHITPMDVLILINEINDGRGGRLPPELPTPEGGSGEAPYMPDVNGDGNLTPLDVLYLIKELNEQQGTGASGEGEWVQADTAPSTHHAAYCFQPLDDDERSQIDAELELLLDEMAAHRFRR